MKKMPPDQNETVAGIDCGLKNLAIVIASRDKKTKAIRSIKFWDVIDIASDKKKRKAAKSIADKDLLNELLTVLNATNGQLAEQLKQCTQITIEKQMTQAMNRVAYMLYTMLSMDYMDATVQFASGTRKNNYLKKSPQVIEWRNGQAAIKQPKLTKSQAYRINKQMSVVYLKHFVQLHNLGKDLVITRLKKIDDLGDALCYCCI